MLLFWYYSTFFGFLNAKERTEKSIRANAPNKGWAGPERLYLCRLNCRCLKPLQCAE